MIRKHFSIDWSLVGIWLYAIAAACAIVCGSIVAYHLANSPPPSWW
jgi:hypothetical protein